MLLRIFFKLLAWETKKPVHTELNTYTQLHYHILMKKYLESPASRSLRDNFSTPTSVEEIRGSRGCWIAHTKVMCLQNWSMKLMVSKAVPQQFYTVLLGSVTSLMDIYNDQMQIKSRHSSNFPCQACDQNVSESSLENKPYTGGILSVYQITLSYMRLQVCYSLAPWSRF